jgi:hypothetical protein
MRTFSKMTFSSAAERRLYLDLNPLKDVEAKLSKPLSPEANTDALKMKELSQRFRFGLFHVTDSTRGLYYKVEVDDANFDREPVIYYFADDGKSYPCCGFPRPFKIELTTGTAHNIKKDVTHFFE